MDQIIKLFTKDVGTRIITLTRIELWQSTLKQSALLQLKPWEIRHFSLLIVGKFRHGIIGHIENCVKFDGSHRTCLFIYDNSFTRYGTMILWKVTSKGHFWKKSHKSGISSYVSTDFGDVFLFLHVKSCCRTNCVIFKTEPIIPWG